MSVVADNNENAGGFPLEALGSADRGRIDQPQMAAQWARIRGRLQSEVGDVEYRTWLRQMTLAGLDGDEITGRIVLVNRGGNYFLSDTGFAKQQHGRPGTA